MPSRNREPAVPLLRLYRATTRPIVTRPQRPPRVSRHILSLLDLPTEILVDILRWLPYADLVANRRVCKRFKPIIDETSLLQYIIERGAAGYVFNEIFPTEIADALASFRKLQRLYRSPMPTWIASIDLSNTEPYLFQHAWRSWRHSAADGVLIGISADGNALGFLFLSPSVADGSRFRALTIGSDAAIEYAYFDSSQDLLVVVNNRGEITLRSFSTGTTHPQCTSEPVRSMRMPPLRLQDREGPIERSISVSGQWLLACNKVDHPSFRNTDRSKLYHWPSGREQTLQLVRGQGSRPLQFGCMTHGHALVPFTTRSKDSYIAVFSLGTCPDEPPIHRASYALPFPGDVGNYSFLPPTLYSPAYYGFNDTDSATAVLALGPDGRIVVRTPIFTHNLDTSADAPHLVVPWKMWGPTHTRALHWHEDKYGTYASSGLHMFIGDRVLDFNPHDIAHNVYATENPSDDVGSTIVSKSKVTSLPYGEETDWGTPPTRDSLYPWDTCMPFRVTPLRLPPVRGYFRAFGRALLQEEHGPQLCRYISLDDSMTPRFVEYYSL